MHRFHPVSIVAQGVLEFDVRPGITAILNDAGDEIGTSELLQPRRQSQHATFVLREHDATIVSLTVHPTVRKPDPRRFRIRVLWHPVTGPLGESVGFVTRSSAFTVDGQRVLHNANWGTSGVSWPLHRNGFEVALVKRIARRPGRKSNVRSRFRSERVRITISRSLQDEEVRRLAIGALLVTFLAARHDPSGS